MVTRAGKKLLKNTIRTIDYHNRVLEEQDMWRQWELQQGLTMMVSDDVIHSHAKSLREKLIKSSRELNSQCSIQAELQNHDVKSLKKIRNYWLRQLVEVEEKDPDRWGHSGYKELYPEEFDSPRSSKHTSRHRSTSKKRAKERKRHKKKKPIKRKSRSYKGDYKNHSNIGYESSSSSCSSSTCKNEILKEFSKKRKANKHKEHECLCNNKYKKYCKTNDKKNRKKSKHKRHSRKLTDDNIPLEEIWVEKTTNESNTDSCTISSPSDVCTNYVNPPLNVCTNHNSPPLNVNSQLGISNNSHLDVQNGQNYENVENNCII